MRRVLLTLALTLALVGCGDDGNTAVPPTPARCTRAPGSTAMFAACQERYQGNPDGPTLAIAGDSITFQSCPAIHRELDGSFQVACNASEGETTYQTIGETTPFFMGDVDYTAALDPDIVVINLGTNDVRSSVAGTPGYDVDRITANLAALRQKFTGCVISVTIDSHVNTSGSPNPADYNQRAARINESLPREHLVDLDAETAAHPEYISDVHLTPAGQARYAQLIRDAVAEC